MNQAELYKNIDDLEFEYTIYEDDQDNSHSEQIDEYNEKDKDTRIESFFRKLCNIIEKTKRFIIYCLFGNK